MNSNLSLKAMSNCTQIISRTQFVKVPVGNCHFFSIQNLRKSPVRGYTFHLLHTSHGARNLSASNVCTTPVFMKYRSINGNGRGVCELSRNISLQKFCTSSISLGVDKSISAPLTKRQAQDLILRLTGEERLALLSALQEFQAEKTKTEYEGQLAGRRWRSKFGRPSKLPRLGDVDPTGSYCPMPDDWIKKKYAESAVPPTNYELWRVALHNALPFIGFGFLDNFFMILFGDTIEMTVGTMMVLSTMAAAALGNTISDVLGIGSAWYVERLACRVGMRAPELTPVQLDMVSSRLATNLGRVVGVVVGCLLGMTPLLFLGNKSETETKKDEEPKPT